MLEYVGSVLLLPAACAVVAMLVLRIRVPPLSLIGAGHAGSVLATVARGVLDVPAFPRLGLFDPFLWVTTCGAGGGLRRPPPRSGGGEVDAASPGDAGLRSQAGPRPCARPRGGAREPIAANAGRGHTPREAEAARAAPRSGGSAGCGRRSRSGRGPKARRTVPPPLAGTTQGRSSARYEAGALSRKRSGETARAGGPMLRGAGAPGESRCSIGRRRPQTPSQRKAKSTATRMQGGRKVPLARENGSFGCRGTCDRGPAADNGPASCRLLAWVSRRGGRAEERMARRWWRTRGGDGGTAGRGHRIRRALRRGAARSSSPNRATGRWSGSWASRPARTSGTRASGFRSASESARFSPFFEIALRSRQGAARALSAPLPFARAASRSPRAPGGRTSPR
jgi:hypothetical protein